MAESTQLTLFEEPADRWKPVRDDFNFCRLALFVSSDRRGDRFRDIEQRYVVDVNGKSFEATWEVRHDAKLGLPGTFDRDVWLGIMEIVQELTDSGRKPVPEVVEITSMREFLRKIGKNDGGKFAAKVKESIRRLTRTTCFTEKSFNCPTSGGYLQLVEPIHLIEKCAFKGEVSEDGTQHVSTWIKLGDYVRRNLQSGYIALLDVSYIRSLSGEFSKQLIPFLSYRFWLASQRGRDYISVDWEELAVYLAANGWDTLNRAKQRLEQPIDELKKRKYISDSSCWQDNKLFFVIGEKFIDELQDRINAKEQYKSWIAGRSQSKQLRLINGSDAVQVRRPTQEDERQAVLTRQAIKVGLLQQQPDTALLHKHGWAIEDVVSLAKRLSERRATT